MIVYVKSPYYSMLQRCFLHPVLQLGKEKFHKSQHFDYSNGVAMLVGSEKPGIGGELLVGQKIKPKYSVYPKGQGSGLPSWVAFDKQVTVLKWFCLTSPVTHICFCPYSSMVYSLYSYIYITCSVAYVLYYLSHLVH